MTAGLALSGGGLLGAAHLGVLQELDAMGCVPDVVSGTSAGGLVAVAMGMGVRTEDLIAFGQMVAQHPFSHFRPNALRLAAEAIPEDPLPPATGILDPGPFLQGLLALTPAGSGLMAALRMPVAVTAVDLGALLLNVFVSRDVVRHPQGRFRIDPGATAELAAHATMSVPGVFSAAENGGRLLVDGGVGDTLPVDWAWAMGADRILAVDVAPAGGLPQRAGLGTVLARTEAYMTETLSALREPPQAHVLTVSPKTRGIGPLDFAAFDRLVSLGRQAARTKSAEIRSFFAV